MVAEAEAEDVDIQLLVASLVGDGLEDVPEPERAPGDEPVTEWGGEIRSGRIESVDQFDVHQPVRVGQGGIPAHQPLPRALRASVAHLEAGRAQLPDEFGQIGGVLDLPPDGDLPVAVAGAHLDPVLVFVQV